MPAGRPAPTRRAIASDAGMVSADVSVVAQATLPALTATPGPGGSETYSLSMQTLLLMTSLSFLRLVDAIEIAYGVEIDLENDLERMRTVASIVDFLTEYGVR